MTGRWWSKVLGVSSHSLVGKAKTDQQTRISSCRLREVARRVRTSGAAIAAKQAEEARDRRTQARSELRQALSQGIQSRNQDLSDISNESAPFLQIQAGDGYPIGTLLRARHCCRWVFRHLPAS